MEELGPTPAPPPPASAALAPEEGGSALRYGNPWADPPSARDPLRRLRGHLALPVTVWLADNGDHEPPVGLTVSSVLLSPGEPPMAAGLVTASSDLADVLGSPPGRFVVHVLGAAHRRLAQHFAGDVPAPAPMLSVRHSAHGPLLDAVGDRVLCRVVAIRPFGWALLVEAEVDDVHVADAGKGLAWYHGAYHVLGT
jgi:3-hydroxy-9,10-secoandrosta-1,3,5(10)-triene-9,17-dione monooxygenase reductase component